MSGREQFETWVASALMSGLAMQVGELVAIADDGCAPLVIIPADPSGTVLRATSVVDVHAAHIGRKVLLAFVNGDPSQPVVLGLMRGAADQAQTAGLGKVEIDADGERLVVRAKEQLVLRCGKASITLTRAGKVLIEGAYVLSRSTGVNRVKGGSVQLN
jgi:hypothetical protein